MTRALTTVVNVKLHSYDVYIGRAGHGLDGYFGNSHPVGVCFQCGHHDRGDALKAFKKDFLKKVKTNPVFRERVLALAGKRLGCFCVRFPWAPDDFQGTLVCHGQVMAKWIEAQLKPKRGRT